MFTVLTAYLLGFYRERDLLVALDKQTKSPSFEELKKLCGSTRPAVTLKSWTYFCGVV
jgi:hypothetical protein